MRKVKLEHSTKQAQIEISPWQDNFQDNLYYAQQSMRSKRQRQIQKQACLSQMNINKNFIVQYDEEKNKQKNKQLKTVIERNAMNDDEKKQNSKVRLQKYTSVHIFRSRKDMLIHRKSSPAKISLNISQNNILQQPKKQSRKLYTHGQKSSQGYLSMLKNYSAHIQSYNSTKLSQIGKKKLQLQNRYKYSEWKKKIQSLVLKDKHSDKQKQKNKLPKIQIFWF